MLHENGSADCIRQDLYVQSCCLESGAAKAAGIAVWAIGSNKSRTARSDCCKDIGEMRSISIA